MNCQECESSRIAEISGKVKDMCVVSIRDDVHDGYVPGDLNIGEGDYLTFKVCLTCGQMQGDYPLERSTMETDEDGDDDALTEDEVDDELEAQDDEDDPKIDDFEE